MIELIFTNYGRLDLGLGNPNKTAVLFATLIVASWAFSAIKRWGFWLSLGLSTVLAVGLMLTYSRGGIVATLAGLTCVAFWAPRPWLREKVIGSSIALLILIGVAILLPKSVRFLHGIVNHDLSIANRLLIWKSVPNMIWDAPDGWGVGKSGDAYMQWYQPIGRLEGYRTLVNSHLTWLVEWNWLYRIAYVMAWALVLLVLRPGNRWFSVALGIWVAFGTAAFFSSTEELWILWILPVIAFLAVLSWRTLNGVWPSRGALAGAPVASAVSVALLIIGLAKLHPSDVSISHRGDQVFIGGQRPSIWLLKPDRSVLGDHFGQTLRQLVMNSEKGPEKLIIGTTDSVDTISSEIQAKTHWIVSGKAPSSLPKAADQIIFLNSFFLSSNELKARTGKEDVVVIGAFVEDSLKAYWNNVGQQLPSYKLIQDAGRSQYLSNWVNYLQPR